MLVTRIYNSLSEAQIIEAVREGEAGISVNDICRKYGFGTSRFNRTYRTKVLDAYWFDDLQKVKHVTEEWRTEYNNERPHESLGN